jgi:hypothetical protein
MTRDDALLRVRAMWQRAADDGYRHTLEVYADELMAVQSETARRCAEIAIEKCQCICSSRASIDIRKEFGLQERKGR